MTTGEGGMAVSDNADLTDRMRQMSLHGLSHDAWKRYAGNHAWDYRIVAPGYKYNFTDVAASIGIHQLARAEAMRCERERIARLFRAELAGLEQIDLPPDPPDRCHAWHLFPIHLHWTGSLSIAIASSRSCAKTEWAARCTGGRCICTPITRSNLPGGRSICRWRQPSGPSSSRSPYSPACKPENASR